MAVLRYRDPVTKRFKLIAYGVGTTSTPTPTPGTGNSCDTDGDGICDCDHLTITGVNYNSNGNLIYTLSDGTIWDTDNPPVSGTNIMALL